MPFIDPTQVTSPKAHWKLLEVLHTSGDEGDSLAVGEWDGKRVLGMRWNGSNKAPGVGNPQSRGMPTWFIVPERYRSVILGTLRKEVQLRASVYLGETQDEPV